MMRPVGNAECPGLLVSVRSAAEALEALAGGADVIDVKEPARGPLGPADAETIGEVVDAVAGRAPVTAAAGELIDFQFDAPVTVAGVSLFKIGLAGCALRDDWQTRWSHVSAAMPGGANLVAVAYADWQSVDAIAPSDVLEAATELRCPALLIDTWNKSAGTLFDHWPLDDLQAFVRQVRQRGMIAVVAGSLTLANLREAAQLGPDLIAVRGAACERGRGGAVSRDRVVALRERLIAAAKSSESAANSV